MTPAGEILTLRAEVAELRGKLAIAERVKGEVVRQRDALKIRVRELLAILDGKGAAPPPGQRQVNHVARSSRRRGLPMLAFNGED